MVTPSPPSSSGRRSVRQNSVEPSRRINKQDHHHRDRPNNRPWAGRTDLRDRAGTRRGRGTIGAGAFFCVPCERRAIEAGVDPDPRHRMMRPSVGGRGAGPAGGTIYCHVPHARGGRLRKSAASVGTQRGPFSSRTPAGCTSLCESGSATTVFATNRSRNTRVATTGAQRTREFANYHCGAERGAVRDPPAPFAAAVGVGVSGGGDGFPVVLEVGWGLWCCLFWFCFFCCEGLFFLGVFFFLSSESKREARAILGAPADVDAWSQNSTRSFEPAGGGPAR